MVSQESSAPQTGVGPIVPESLPSHVPHSFPPRIDLGPASSPVRVHLTRILEQLQASATENGTDIATTLAVLQRQRITTEAAALLRSASRGDKRDAGTEADSNNLNDKFMEVMADAVLTDALGPDNEREQTDMSLPASQYFVSSSHNTYLRGNQLYGEASTSVYKDVLLAGCRCLEIDVWDGVPPESAPATTTDSDTDSARERKESTAKKLLHTGSTKLHGMHKGAFSGAKHGARFLSSLSNHFDVHGKPSEGSSSDTASKEATQDEESKQVTAPVEPTAQESAPTQEQPTATTTESSTSPPPRAEPRVLHGHTFTKEVSFRDVCYAIRDSAFVTSDLPVIVSLETHTSLEQQQAMVDIMTEAWTGLLVDVSPELWERLLHGEADLPSPDQLRRKILVKAKYAPPDEDDVNNGETIDVAKPETQDKDKKQPKVLAALSNMGVYTAAFSFKSFDSPEASLPNHIFSFTEHQVKDAASSPRTRQALLTHNRRFLMRAYPLGLRVNSSNLDPTLCWRQGVQFAALNWQSLDHGMMINEAMFGGTNGWRLKPAPYRAEEFQQLPPATADEQTRQNNGEYRNSGDSTRKTFQLSIDIFAGANLRPSNPDKDLTRFRPCVTARLYVDSPWEGVLDSTGNLATVEEPSASASSLSLSSTVNLKAPHKENKEDKEFERQLRQQVRPLTTPEEACGSDPDFGGVRLAFPRCADVLEELGFIQIKVKDQADYLRDELSSWACIRLDRLRPGYRFVRLRDMQGEAGNGVLLVRVNKDYF